MPMPASWTLDIAEDLRQDCYYTFYIPSPAVLEQIKPGDLVRLRFAFHNNEPDAPAAERMWVEVASRVGSHCTGYLTNEPLYIPDLQLGALIEFDTVHIINTEYPDPDDVVERYINRCMVSHRVLRDKQPVGYFYREESLGEKDGFQDTGWRILSGEESQEYLDDAANSSFVSLGVVLNVDDSILPYLDAPEGSSFARDEKTNVVPED